MQNQNKEVFCQNANEPVSNVYKIQHYDEKKWKRALIMKSEMFSTVMWKFKEMNTPQCIALKWMVLWLSELDVRLTWRRVLHGLRL